MFKEIIQVPSFIILSLCLVIFINAQDSKPQVNQSWVKTYNGPGNNYDRAQAVAVDASGNIYVTGASTGIGTSLDYTTIKYTSAGIRKWVSSYNGPGNNLDVPLSIAVDGSGNVYVTGRSGGTFESIHTNDIVTIKYNSSGVQQWVARYNGNDNLFDEGISIAVDNSGNVYITGDSADSTSSGYGHHFVTIKYGTAGNTLWVRKLDELSRGNSIALDASGNVYVTGGGNLTGLWKVDFLTMKYNSSGEQQWASRYDGALGYDEANSIAVDGSGNVYVTGGSEGLTSASDFAVIKYSAIGIQQWANRFNGAGNGEDIANSIAVDALGNAFVTGSSTGSGTGKDYTTIKYSASGTQEWVNLYNGPVNGEDISNAVKVDGSGNVYIAGRSDGSVYADFATIKYSASGVQQWLQRYNGQPKNSAFSNSLAVDGSGNVYVAGGVYVNIIDFVTIKYAQSQNGPFNLTPVSTNGSLTPDRFNLYQNYPNPFNPSTVVRYQVPVAGFVMLKVYDMLGREVAILVDEQLKQGTYEVDWNASNVPSGVYFYKLSAGDYIETKKMILIK